MPERFEIYILYKRRYINTLPFLFFSKSQPSDLKSNYETNHDTVMPDTKYYVLWDFLNSISDTEHTLYTSYNHL